MKRNTGLVLFIILLTLIATSLGYYFGKRASFPNKPTEGVVVTDGSTVNMVESNPLILTTSEKKYISVDGKECEIAQRTENPYKSGEFVVFTKNNCPDMYSPEPRFFIENATGRKEITLSREQFEYNNPLVYNEKIFEYISGDEILYESAYGEGAACQSGFGSAHVRLNFRTMAVKKEGYLISTTECHDPIPGTEEEHVPDQCWDSVEKYERDGIAKLIFSQTCPERLNTGKMILSVDYNGKRILERTISQKETQREIKVANFVFSGLEATSGLMAGKKTISFSADNVKYTLNIITGVLSSQ